MGCQWNNCDSAPLHASFASTFEKLALEASRPVARLSRLVASPLISLSLPLTLLYPTLSFPSSSASISSIAQNARSPAVSCLQTSISSRGKLTRPSACVSLTVSSRRVASLSPSSPHPALPHSLLPIFPDSTLVFVLIARKASSPDLLPADRHQSTLVGAPSRCPSLSLPPSSPASGYLSLSQSFLQLSLSLSISPPSSPPPPPPFLSLVSIFVSFPLLAQFRFLSLSPRRSSSCLSLLPSPIPEKYAANGDFLAQVGF